MSSENVSPIPFPTTPKSLTLTKTFVNKITDTNQKQSFKKILKTSVPMQNKNPFPKKKLLQKKNHKNLSKKLYS